MRKLFNELFYIPKHGTGKMREKAFLARITVSVFAIIFFLFAMGITAYAWFSGSIVSSTNNITSAVYDLDITVKNANGEEQATTFVDKDTVELNEANVPQDYVVNIELGANCTASTGFCVIEVDYLNDDGTSDGIADETYHTAQIGKDVGVSDDYIRSEYTLYIRLNQAAKLTFSQYWGTSSYYNSLNDVATDSIRYLTENATTKEAPLVLGESKETPQSQNEEEQKTTDTKTVPKVTKPSDNTSDAATSTTPTTSDTTTPTEQSTPTPPTSDATPSTEMTEESTDTESTEQTQPETEGTETTGESFTETSE